MEVYILDSSFRRTEVVEQFESFIWTERWADQGEFSLDIDPSFPDSTLFEKGKYIACDKSDRMMVVTTVENALADDGTRKLKVTGASFESIMEERANFYDMFTLAGSTVTDNPPISKTWGNGTTDKPMALVRTIFNAACVTNSIVASDIIPQMQSGDYYSKTGMIAEPTNTPVIQSQIDSLWNTIKTICDTYRMGFRIVRIEDVVPTNAAKLYFEVYTGFDRTAGQTALAAIVFSNQMDNLTDTSELSSISGYKNMAYVVAPHGTRLVVSADLVGTPTGNDRKVLLVDANDIDDAAGATLQSKLEQRGQQELAKTRVIVGFDGKIPIRSGLMYGTDYKLGDLVEQRSDSGARRVMRVTEQIFISDAQGERNYPTLTQDSLIVAGAWDAQLATKKWDDFTTEVWNSI
jgi:hypothetical protein